MPENRKRKKRDRVRQQNRVNVRGSIDIRREHINPNPKGRKRRTAKPATHKATSRSRDPRAFHLEQEILRQLSTRFPVLEVRGVYMRKCLNVRDWVLQETGKAINQNHANELAAGGKKFSVATKAEQAAATKQLDRLRKAFYEELYRRLLNGS